jgi:hypothetical protein
MTRADTRVVPGLTRRWAIAGHSEGGVGSLLRGALASAATTLMGRGTSNVLSNRYATSPIRAIPDAPQPKLLVRNTISVLTAS